ncbi:hypothetical protein CBF23_004945 [Marinomonas agarivorans]|nr:hypothetical protein CBF23_004945 [Marinomonas agarivorans]
MTDLHPQLANALVMVRPVDFGFNEETALDNEFQHKPSNANQVRENALVEFDNMVTNLRAAGITVLVLEKNENQAVTPDAVFPNNWFSTNQKGDLIVYPMFAENRRQERRIDELEALLAHHNYQVNQRQILGDLNEKERILEGTGVLVIDHEQGTLYASESERCHPEQLAHFQTKHGYKKSYLFQTKSSKGKPIYHTNVMMSVGRGFAVICNECFANPDEYQQVKQALSQTREVIEISLRQMEQHFCGNILHVCNNEGEPLIVMSQQAYDGFNALQKASLEKYGRLLPNPINTIEDVGGGSARCMIAEVFLPSLN